MNPTLFDKSKDILNKRQEKKSARVDFEYQALGLEIMEEFGTQYRNRIWSLFHSPRFSVSFVRQVFFDYKKLKIKPDEPFKYFIGMLYH
jgi:hypothetical protein